MKSGNLTTQETFLILIDIRMDMLHLTHMQCTSTNWYWPLTYHPRSQVRTSRCPLIAFVYIWLRRSLKSVAQAEVRETDFHRESNSGSVSGHPCTNHWATTPRQNPASPLLLSYTARWYCNAGVALCIHHHAIKYIFSILYIWFVWCVYHSPSLSEWLYVATVGLLSANKCAHFIRKMLNIAKRGANFPFTN